MASPQTKTKLPRLAFSQKDQLYVENQLLQFFNDEKEGNHFLKRNAHAEYLLKNMKSLPESVSGLHCSRPWLVYWTLQAADLLGVTSKIYEAVPARSIASFLKMCLVPDDREICCNDGNHRASALPTGGEDEEEGLLRLGFAGGPAGQIPHLATSYAAVCALCILGLKDELLSLDRKAITRWLISLRSKSDGSFRMHNGGETDTRATYCAAVIAHLLQLEQERIFSEESGEYIAKCQTFEGGFGCDAIGGTEAHGGYTACGLAALILLKRTDLMDLGNVTRWCANRQQINEGGFTGRTNKLVDSCYSYWIGSSCAMIDIAKAQLKLIQQESAVEEKELDDDGGDDQKDDQEEGKEKRKMSAEKLTPQDIFFLDYGQLLDIGSLVMDNNNLPSSLNVIPMQSSRLQCLDLKYQKLKEKLCEEEKQTKKFNDDVEAGEKVKVEKQKKAAAPAHFFTTPFSSSKKASEGNGEEVDEEIRISHDQLCRLPDISGELFFSQYRLQDYVFRCCQYYNGGLMDKPDHPNDAYHTCYSLSGVAIAQNLMCSFHEGKELAMNLQQGICDISGEVQCTKWVDGEPCLFGSKSTTQKRRKCNDDVEHLPKSKEDQNVDQKKEEGINKQKEQGSGCCSSNQLRVSNPIFNICKDRVIFAVQTFSGRSFVTPGS